MGEIADMMIDGTLDAITGEYIDGKSPGFPRTMDGSLSWEKSKQNYIGGLRKFITDHAKLQEDPRAVIDRYIKEAKVKGNGFREQCRNISENFFTHFRKWCLAQSSQKT